MRRQEAASPLAFQRLPVGAAAQSLTAGPAHAVRTREGAAPLGRRVCGPEGWAPWGQQEQVPMARRRAPEPRVAFKQQSWTQIMVLIVFSHFLCRIER